MGVGCRVVLWQAALVSTVAETVEVCPSRERACIPHLGTGKDTRTGHEACSHSNLILVNPNGKTSRAARHTLGAKQVFVQKVHTTER